MQVAYNASVFHQVNYVILKLRVFPEFTFIRRINTPLKTLKQKSNHLIHFFNQINSNLTTALKRQKLDNHTITKFLLLFDLLISRGGRVRTSNQSSLILCTLQILLGEFIEVQYFYKVNRIRYRIRSIVKHKKLIL